MQLHLRGGNSVSQAVSLNNLFLRITEEFGFRCFYIGDFLLFRFQIMQHVMIRGSHHIKWLVLIVVVISNNNENR